MIHEYCLVSATDLLITIMNVGEPRVFRQSNPFLISRCIDLLKVNTIVRSEVLETFYGKNVWRLPDNTPQNLYQEPFVSQDQLISPCFSQFRQPCHKRL